MVSTVNRKITASEGWILVAEGPQNVRYSFPRGVGENSVGPTGSPPQSKKRGHLLGQQAERDQLLAGDGLFICGDGEFVLTAEVPLITNTDPSAFELPSLSITPASTTIPTGTAAGSTLATLSFSGGSSSNVTLSGQDRDLFVIDGTSLNLAADAQEGQYTVTVTASNPAGSSSATHSLTVEPLADLNWRTAEFDWTDSSYMAQANLVTNALLTAEADVATVPHDLAALATQAGIAIAQAYPINDEDWNADLFGRFNADIASGEDCFKLGFYAQNTSAAETLLQRMQAAGITRIHLHNPLWHKHTSIPTDMGPILDRNDAGAIGDLEIAVKARLNAQKTQLTSHSVIPAHTDFINEWTDATANGYRDPVSYAQQAASRQAYLDGNAAEDVDQGKSPFIYFCLRNMPGSTPEEKIENGIVTFAGWYRDVFPDAVLVMNDYETLVPSHPHEPAQIDASGTYVQNGSQVFSNRQDIKPKQDRILNLARALSARGALDAVGEQLHLIAHESVNLDQLRARAETFASYGLDIIITEANIAYKGSGNAMAFNLGSDAEANFSASALARVLDALMPWVKVIIFWSDSNNFGPAQAWTLFGRAAGSVVTSAFGISPVYLAFAYILQRAASGHYQVRPADIESIDLMRHRPFEFSGNGSVSEAWGTALQSGGSMSVAIADIFHSFDAQSDTLQITFRHTAGGSGTLLSLDCPGNDIAVNVAGDVASLVYNGASAAVGAVNAGMNTITIRQSAGQISAGINGGAEVALAGSEAVSAIWFGSAVGGTDDWTTDQPQFSHLRKGPGLTSQNDGVIYAMNPAAPLPDALEPAPVQQPVARPVLYELQFVDPAVTAINNRNIADHEHAVINTGYSADLFSHYATPGALVLRGQSSNRNATATASFDMTGGTVGETYDVRMTILMNNLNADVGSVRVAAEWQDEAGTTLGIIFEDPAMDVAADTLIVDDQFETVMPVGATRIRLIANPNDNTQVWRNCNVLVYNFGVAGAGGTGTWSKQPVANGGQDLGVRSEITVAGETFTFRDAVPMTMLFDGSVHVPQGAVITGQSAAQSAGRSQVMKNPTYSRDASWQGWDSRMEGYNTTEQASYPITFAHDDVVIPSKSRATVGEVRDGSVYSKPVFFCTAQTPHPSAPPPGLIRSRADAANLPALEVSNAIDWTARFATLPSHAVTIGAAAAKPSPRAIRTAYRTDVGFNMNRATDRGYEHLMNHRSLGSRGSNNLNYGVRLAEANDILLTIFDQAYPTSERLAAYRIAACWGIQLMRSAAATGYSVIRDGGHGQFHQAACLIGLHALGQVNTGALSDWLATDGFGNFGQAFEITQALLDNEFVPHQRAYNDATPGAQAWFQRPITAISGDRITVAHNREFQVKFTGLTVYRNGASSSVATVAAMQGGNKDGSAAGWYFDVGAGEGAAFTVGDLVHFGWINGTAPAVGTHAWSEGDLHDFSPSLQTGYVGLQAWLSQYLIAKMVGVTRPEWSEFLGYVENARADPALVYPVEGKTAYLDAWDTLFPTISSL